MQVPSHALRKEKDYMRNSVYTVKCRRCGACKRPTDICCGCNARTTGWPLFNTNDASWAETINAYVARKMQEKIDELLVKGDKMSDEKPYVWLAYGPLLDQPVVCEDAATAKQAVEKAAEACDIEAACPWHINERLHYWYRNYDAYNDKTVPWQSSYVRRVEVQTTDPLEAADYRKAPTCWTCAYRTNEDIGHSVCHKHEKPVFSDFVCDDWQGRDE